MSRRLALELEEPLQGATTSTTRIYTSFPLSSLTYFLASLHVAHTFPLTLGTNDPQKTTELFSFGRPEEEKLKSRHHPQREATAPTVNVVNRRPLHRQRESGGVRKHPRDPVTERKRTVYSSLLAITVGQLVLLQSL
ncbi:hypothetical protein Taro_045124 [Colocasia esculenta]|uniref:Uncharacterized protein n=1 Tax=Colocasia esculenta TaxID=4460 RepID=A0A843WZL1_COLES|nr:hypothetical protein [Colocasia esculenta]